MGIAGKSIRSGRNADNTALNEGAWVRCSRCGFACHPGRDTQMPYGSKTGMGISHYSTLAYNDSDTEYNESTVSYNGNVRDFTISGGCPFCGSYTYGKREKHTRPRRRARTRDNREAILKHNAYLDVFSPLELPR